MVELLVVIAIIAILASMLLPALGAARQRAQQALCVGNVRQTYTSLAVYTGDYDDALPTAEWETCGFNHVVAWPACAPSGLAVLQQARYAAVSQFFCPASRARPSGPNYGFNNGEHARTSFQKAFSYYANGWPYGPKLDYVLSYNRYGSARSYPDWQCNTFTQLNATKLWLADGYTTQWSRPYHLLIHDQFRNMTLGWTDGGVTLYSNWLRFFNPSASWWATGVNELPNHTFWSVMRSRR